MKSRFNLVAAGFALTALSYGLARFAYGLLLPAISADLSLSVTAAGWIGGSAFAAYCVGIVFAFVAGARLGERGLTVLAGLVATSGIALVAVSTSAPMLGVAIALAGLSTGLTSPPLAAAVARCLDDAARPKANGAINAGTAAGIIFSGLAVIAFASAWREIYALFAVIGAVVTAWLWFAVPPKPAEAKKKSRHPVNLRRPGFYGLAGSAFLMGASSTAIWTFGAQVLRTEFDFSDGRIAMAWIVLGAAGMAGAVTGLLTTRFGIAAVHRLALLVMGVALVTLASAGVAPGLAFGAMGLFGVAYIVSTGVYLLWGIELFPDRPDLGLGLPFLMIALGQTAGAPFFGALLDAAGGMAAVLTFAALTGVSAIWIPRVSPRSAKLTPPSGPTRLPTASDNGSTAAR